MVHEEFWNAPLVVCVSCTLTGENVIGYFFLFGFFLLGKIFFVNADTFFLNVIYLQDDTTFEKQSALFALTISDIVLINM